MKKYCYLVYDYKLQIPAACFDLIDELAAFLGRSKAVLYCGITRLKKGEQKYVRDTNGYRYYIYKVELED